MAHTLNENLQVGTAVIIQSSLGTLSEATITKRTPSGAQIVTTGANGHTIRWGANWKGEPTVYGNSGYGQTSSLYMPDSEQVTRARAALERKEFERKFREAFAAADTRNPSIEAIETLQELLPSWLDRAKARRAEADIRDAEWAALQAARGW